MAEVGMTRFHVMTDEETKTYIIRKVSSNPAYRKTFKPDKLCGDVDELLSEIQSWLSLLRWSVAVTRISKLQNQLKNFQNYDYAFYMAFDDYANDLSNLAIRLDQALASDKPTKHIVASIRSRTTKVRNDVAKTLKAVQTTHKEVSI